MSIPFALLTLLLTLFGGGATSSADGARATEAKANLKQLVNAIESCAASRVDGTYTGDAASGPQCLTPAQLVEEEPALAQLPLAAGTPRVGAYQVAPIGTKGQGYLVQAGVDGGYYAELHRPDGSVDKPCGGTPTTVAPDESITTPAPSPGSTALAGCDDGAW